MSHTGRPGGLHVLRGRSRCRRLLPLLLLLLRDHRGGDGVAASQGIEEASAVRCDRWDAVPAEATTLLHPPVAFDDTPLCDLIR